MGAKRITYEFVKESFENEGCTLISKEYNNKTKLDYICSKGHEHSIRWGDWQQGYRCLYCAGKAKLTIEYIKESFKSKGYTLVSREYINSSTKLDYRCSEGHEHNITWGNWVGGNRCPYCVGKAKLTLKQVSKSFNNEGYILLSNEYINNSTKLTYQCPKGHEHSIKWNHWQRGHRCITCFGNTKPILDYIRESLKKEDYILLSEEYKNAITKLNYRCSKGHEHNITWGHWYEGKRCPTCRNINHSIKYSGSGHPNWQGGISYEPYCPIWKDKEYKQDIRNRDGNKCLNPYCYSNKPDKLTIHHIDYNKKNCSPSNLITVCNSCNVSANKDRDWHTTWYSAIIKNRYYSRSV